MKWDLFTVKDIHSFKRYQKLIISVQNGDFDHYDLFETHHIFPKSLFPDLSKEKSNLVKVPLKLHFLLHYLLYKFTKTKEMTFAFNQMKRISKNSRLYVNARIEISQIISDTNRGRSCTESQKQNLSDIFSNTCCYRSPQGERKRITIGLQPEGWVPDQTGRVQPESQKIKVGNSNRGRQIFHNDLTGEVVFTRDQPDGEGWVPGQTDEFSGKMTEILTDLYWYYNVATGEQTRSKVLPEGDGWVKKRQSKGNFKGFSEINMKYKVLNLITKKIELVDEKSSFHINHPGRSYSNIVFIQKGDTVFCNKQTLDFPFNGTYNVDTLTKYRIPRPHHNMTKENHLFCSENAGKSLSDLGYRILSLYDFHFSDSLILQE